MVAKITNVNVIRIIAPTTIRLMICMLACSKYLALTNIYVSNHRVQANTTAKITTIIAIIANFDPQRNRCLVAESNQSLDMLFI